MTEQTFGQEEVPPVQDNVSHYAGQAVSPNVYEETKGQIMEVDSMHEALSTQSRQISALMARLAKYETPVENAIAAIPGGAPVAHHLHLVDGRTVVNHGGVGTHFSETLPDGTTKITRIKEYYPAVEVDPSTLNA